MKATIYRTDESVSVVDLPDGMEERLEFLQKAVGGYIEIITVKGKHLVLNEEGKLFGLPSNLSGIEITRNTRWENENLCGDIVLIEGKLE